MVYEALGNRQGAARVLLGEGDVYFRERAYAAAEARFRRALAVARAGDYTFEQGQAQTKLGETLAARGRPAEALAQLRQAAALEARMGQRDQLGNIYRLLSAVHLDLGTRDDALRYGRAALQIANEIGTTELLSESHEALAEAHAAGGNYREAYRHQVRHAALRDSLFNAQRAKILADAEVRYDVARKDMQIEQLNQAAQIQRLTNERQRAWLALVGVALLAAVTVAGTFYNRARLKQKANRLLDARREEVERQKEELEQAYASIEAQNRELERLSVVASRTDNAVLIAGPDGEIEWANEGLRAASGLQLEEWRRVNGSNVLRGDGDGGAREQQIRRAIERRASASFEVAHRNQAGEEYWVASTVTPVIAADGTVREFVVIETDITRRKQAELRLQNSLAEKEVLLKEVHHRVKNNLQIVASLLGIQLGNVGEPRTRAAVRAVRSRVEAMALVHQKLYQSEGLDRVDVQEYLEQLTDSLYQTFDTSGGAVEWEVDAAGVSFDAETAVPLGLIVTELVSNAFKYAFAGRAEGRVRVGVRPAPGGAYELRVEDDGVGIPESVRRGDLGSLGLVLVHDLARQLGGTVQVGAPAGAGSGTVWTVRFTPSTGTTEREDASAAPSRAAADP